MLAETLRAALNALATTVPDLVRQHVQVDWFERYGCRVEAFRLPKGKDARQAYALKVGADGLELLAVPGLPDAPPTLRGLPAVEMLRQTWIQQVAVIDGQMRLRDPIDMPSADTTSEVPGPELHRVCLDDHVWPVKDATLAIGKDQGVSPACWLQAH